MNVKILFLLLGLFPSIASAQGFAGLGTEVDGFAIPERGTNFTFPQDHAAHPDFRIEWWYLTANLTDNAGRDYGVQWTLFRSASQPTGLPEDQLWMGHAAVTTEDAHYHAERLARGATGQAGISQPLDAFIDDWSLTSVTSGNEDLLSAIDLTARGAEFAYRLNLTAIGPLVAHGDKGYSLKSSSGQASYYYSQPFYAVSGTLNLPDGDVNVTGTAWLDREWSSQPLASDQSGWDWFSLNFDSGDKLMAFRLRSTSGDDYTSGTWITADGTPTVLDNGAIELSPIAQTTTHGREVPTSWSVTLPEKDLDITVEAVQPDAWMDTLFPYWEGPIRITGSHRGRGYLEMTGYN